MIQELKLSVCGYMTFCIPIPFYYSGNQMYKVQRAGRKVWTRKEVKVWELQKSIAEQIRDLGLKAPKDTFCYICHTAFFFSMDDWVTKNRSALRQIDLTNLWKPIEDAIFGVDISGELLGLGANDCKGIYNTQSKCILPPEFDTPPYYIATDLTFLKKT
jgi:hypothetical protein